MKVGILAVQGAFAEHQDMIRLAGKKLAAGDKRFAAVEAVLVRDAADLQTLDALILPGGESTTMKIVTKAENLMEGLRHFVKVARKPTWGTCAGCILLSDAVTGHSGGFDQCWNHFTFWTGIFIVFSVFPKYLVDSRRIMLRSVRETAAGPEYKRFFCFIKS